MGDDNGPPRPRVVQNPKIHFINSPDFDVAYERNAST